MWHFKTIKGVELFAVGKWNGHTITRDVLQAIAAASVKLAAVLEPPLKLGHNDEQAMTDGQPAIGWVDPRSVRVDGDKLVADFVDLPDIVYTAILKKLYKKRSIELDRDVEYKGERYPYVLTGVALLGADLPAVNTLQDLKAYAGAATGETLKASRRQCFTVNAGENTMTLEEMQAQLNAQALQFSAMRTTLDGLTAENAKLKADAATREATDNAAREAADAAKFTADKAAVVLKMDALVKTKAILPAQREAFSAQIKDASTLATVSAMVDGLAAGAPPRTGAQFSREQGHAALPGGAEGGSPDDVILERVQALRATPEGARLSFSQARDRVLQSDRALARDYVNLTREK